jgi:hypothetical protein
LEIATLSLVLVCVLYQFLLGFVSRWEKRHEPQHKKEKDDGSA